MLTVATGNNRGYVEMQYLQSAEIKQNILLSRFYFLIQNELKERHLQIYQAKLSEFAAIKLAR